MTMEYTLYGCNTFLDFYTLQTPDYPIVEQDDMYLYCLLFLAWLQKVTLNRMSVSGSVSHEHAKAEAKVSCYCLKHFN